MNSLSICFGNVDFQRVEDRCDPLSLPFWRIVMPLKKPLIPVAPQFVRAIPRSFAWIDHRLRTRQFLVDFEPEEFALYLFLALAADQQGLSCWRLDVMEKTMPSFSFHQLRQARELLLRKRLLAFRPWNLNDPDGTYQLLPVPNVKLEPKNDLRAVLDGIIKTVS